MGDGTAWGGRLFCKQVMSRDSDRIVTDILHQDNRNPRYLYGPVLGREQRDPLHEGLADNVSSLRNGVTGKNNGL